MVRHNENYLQDLFAPREFWFEADKQAEPVSSFFFTVIGNIYMNSKSGFASVIRIVKTNNKNLIRNIELVIADRGSIAATNKTKKIHHGHDYCSRCCLYDS